MTKKKENSIILSQERIAEGIYSMWLKTEAAAEAKPGQFISMYTNEGSKLLPRPISICEIDRTRGALRVVYRVTGSGTGTELFSRMKDGDIVEQGNHEELLAKNGFYAKLYNSQFEQSA